MKCSLSELRLTHVCQMEMLKTVETSFFESLRQGGEDVKENIKLFIESKKFNVQNTLRDVNIIFKMMYERSKTSQLDYFPELKL